MMFQYYVKIVPTTYVKVDGKVNEVSLGKYSIINKNFLITTFQTCLSQFFLFFLTISNFLLMLGQSLLFK